jgi:hypothetical protein
VEFEDLKSKYRDVSEERDTLKTQQKDLLFDKLNFNNRISEVMQR